LTELDLTSYQYPIYLYTVHEALAADPRPLYTLDLIPEYWHENLLGPPINLPRGNYKATVYMKSDGHAQYSVDVVRANDNGVIAHRKLDDATSTSAFDFSAPGDARVQFHLSGIGERSSFQRLTFAYVGASP
jgi:hypothetical protein